MPAITISSDTIPFATVNIQGPTVGDVGVDRLAGDLVVVELAGIECGVRIAGPLETLRTMFAEAQRLLDAMG